MTNVIRRFLQACCLSMPILLLSSAQSQEQPIPASSFHDTDIGSPALAGAVTRTGDGLDIIAGGKDIWGKSDQFHFAYVEREDHFDISVRVDTLSSPNLYTKTGIMVRSNLTAGSPYLFFQVFSGNAERHNNSGGYEFLYRREQDSSSEGIYPPNMGKGPAQFPVTYPNTWMRLKRSGNEFTAYASSDGKEWKLYTVFSMPFPEKVYVGFALTSHNANAAAIAKFRDCYETTNDNER